MVCQTIRRELRKLIDGAKTLANQTDCEVGMTIERIQQIIDAVKKIKDCQKLEKFLNYNTFEAD